MLRCVCVARDVTFSFTLPLLDTFLTSPSYFVCLLTHVYLFHIYYLLQSRSLTRLSSIHPIPLQSFSNVSSNMHPATPPFPPLFSIVLHHCLQLWCVHNGWQQPTQSSQGAEGLSTPTQVLRHGTQRNRDRWEEDILAACFITLLFITPWSSGGLDVVANRGKKLREINDYNVC